MNIHRLSSIADERDRLPDDDRNAAHLMITAHYEAQRRALPSGQTKRRRSPFADIFGQANIATR
ncbi:hypothetical protein [Pseudofrankia sp. BMG5.36]|uniref:hypothetical protein n=1 Tax=Pseudofrankia sp. BMG5.36 TaxID=1834512 RepID=UPI00104273D4|nr:hypothetical protein [Pseudofrankia sp. BMG5.36]